MRLLHLPRYFNGPGAIHLSPFTFHRFFHLSPFTFHRFFHLFPFTFHRFFHLFLMPLTATQKKMITMTPAMKIQSAGLNAAILPS